MQIVVMSLLSIPLITFILIGLSFIFKKKRKKRPKLVLHQGGKQ